MNLLVERNKKEGYPAAYAFSTFFYPKLISGGYKAVRRWTRGVDLFKQDLIIVPIHLTVHWALVVSQASFFFFLIEELNGERKKASKKSHLGFVLSAAHGHAVSHSHLFITGHRCQKENHHVLRLSGTKRGQDLWSVTVSNCSVNAFTVWLRFGFFLQLSYIGAVKTCWCFNVLPSSFLWSFTISFCWPKIQRWRVVFCFVSNSQYLQEESQEKRNLELSFSEWILHSMESHVCENYLDLKCEP